MKILNVTPVEYMQIKDWSLKRERDFPRLMYMYFGIPFDYIYSETYKVVVRWDVPAIPWFSKGVERIEEEKI